MDKNLHIPLIENICVSLNESLITNILRLLKKKSTQTFFHGQYKENNTGKSIKKIHKPHIWDDKTSTTASNSQFLSLVTNFNAIIRRKH